MFTNITTDSLLKMESAGGLLTSGKYPNGLNRNSSIEDWFAVFPNVERDLIRKWSAYIDSRHDFYEILHTFLRD